MLPPPRFILPLAFLLLTLPAIASIQIVAVDPSGACVAPTFTAINATTGQFSDCISSVWTKVKASIGAQFASVVQVDPSGPCAYPPLAFVAVNGASAAITTCQNGQWTTGPPSAQVPATIGSNFPGFVASVYNFASQAGVGSLTGGVATVQTLTPCPIGLNGTDTGHSILVSGGVGTAEGTLITGGTCTSGATTGTIIFTPANNHSGAWGISSASGGLQEAICQILPSAGDWAVVAAPISLSANVTLCGTTDTRVMKLAGAAITSGGFTILGTPVPAGLGWFEFGDNLAVDNPGPAWASFSTVSDGSRFSVGGYPVTAEFGNNTTAIPQALVGGISIPSNSAGTNHGAGVAGYALTAAPTEGAVGSFGYGGILAAGTSSWGGNFLTTNCGQPQCATQTGFTNSVMYGIEIDINEMKLPGGGTPNTATRGLYIIGASEVRSNAIQYGIDVDSLGVTQSPHLKWDAAFRVEDGASTIGLDLGALGTGNTVGSQQVYFRSRNAAGVNANTIESADPNGTWVVTAGGDAASWQDHLGNPMGTLDSTNGFSTYHNLQFKANGSHIWTNAANKDISGTCTFAGTTCTVTFTIAYNSAPVCTASDQTAAGALKVAPATNQVIITGGAGAGATDVISYICFGNPN